MPASLFAKSAAQTAAPRQWIMNFSMAPGEIGIIGSVTEPFCSSCTRVRLTADGKLVTCLFAESGFDLKALLRSGASDDEIRCRNRVRSGPAGPTGIPIIRWEQVQSGGLSAGTSTRRSK